MESNFTAKLMEEKRKIYKELLYKYSIGEYLKGQDFDAVFELLQQHPDAKNKSGIGIKGLLVDRDGYGGRCFHLVRHDGTKENFSYLKCLGYKGDNYNKDKQAKNKKKSEITKNKRQLLNAQWKYLLNEPKRDMEGNNDVYNNMRRLFGSFYRG